MVVDLPGIMAEEEERAEKSRKAKIAAEVNITSHPLSYYLCAVPSFVCMNYCSMIVLCIWIPTFVYVWITVMEHPWMFIVAHCAGIS